jgi:hypothetical protein
MLPFDSPRWSKLEHAYGCAANDTSAPTGWSAGSGFHGYQDIPNVIACIRRLEAAPQRLASSDWQPWDTLVSSLCHQGTIYSASFAAVPHIINIGMRAAARQEIDVGFLLSSPDWRGNIPKLMRIFSLTTLRQFCASTIWRMLCVAIRG